MFIYHFNRMIRSRILWGFFAIIIAFAFVAVDSCFQSPQDSMTAGKINGKKITNETFEEVVQAIRGFGENRDNTTSTAVIDRRAWEQLAARLTAIKNGMGAEKNEIRAILREAPGFQGANGFDINRYRMMLAQQGMTPARYEQLVGHQLTVMKIAALVESANWVSPMELEDELAAMTDRFTVQAATVSNRFTAAQMSLTDGDYRKFYEENKDSFALPDRVAVRYITIPVSNYLAAVSVPEDDLLEFYDSHADTYTRVVSNNVTEPIPFAEVRTNILAELMMDEARYCASTSVTFNIYGKLSNEASNALDIVAAQAKLDVKTSPLVSANDALDWVENAEKFTAAVFELEPDRSDMRFGIVKGKEAIYVIERNAFSAAHTPAYEEVLDELRPRALAKTRSDAFDKEMKVLRADLNEMLAKEKSFMEAAQSKKLNVSTSLTYTVSDIQNQKFDNSFSIAYGTMTLKKGELSEVIPVSAAKALLVYVQERKPGDALSAEMMRAQVSSGISRRRGGHLLPEWLAWNLARQDFNSARPLSSEDEETVMREEDAGDEDF